MPGGNGTMESLAVCLAEKSGMIVDGCCPVEKAASDKNSACEQGCKLMQGDGLKVQGFTTVPVLASGSTKIDGVLMDR